MAVKLNESDWEMLFPAQDFMIGQNTHLDLVPMNLAQLAKITRHLTKIIGQVSQMEITLNDLMGDAPKIVEVVALILSEAPEILSEMSGLDVEDVQRLPLHVGLELFSECLDINLQSQESLIKNFKGLGGKIAKFMGGTQTVQ